MILKRRKRSARFQLLNSAAYRMDDLLLRLNATRIPPAVPSPAVPVTRPAIEQAASAGGNF